MAFERMRVPNIDLKCKNSDHRWILLKNLPDATIPVNAGHTLHIHPCSILHGDYHPSDRRKQLQIAIGALARIDERLR